MAPTPPSPAPVQPAQPAMRPAMRIALALTVVLAVQLAAAAELPAGWFKSGKAPRQFRVGVDERVSRNGGISGYVASWTASPPLYGTLMQEIDADRYRGRRVRFSGWLRTEDVDHEEGWAGLWLRIDDPNGKRLVYDSTEESPVRETSDWTRVAVVLDVPERAEKLAFGFMLVGSGEVWADDLEFEEVGRDVPVTGEPRPGLPKEPRNLGFDEPSGG